MKKFFVILATITLCMALIVACDPKNNVVGPNVDPNKDKDLALYEITVTDNSEWESAKKVVFYGLDGVQAASADIESGKAKANIKEGTYVALINGAPDSVTYRPALVTTKNKVGEIILENSSDDGAGNNNYGVMGVLLSGGEPAVGYDVTICYEPDDGSFGFCLEPQTTDSNGSVYYSRCCSGQYHVQVNLSGEYDTLTESNVRISASMRFFTVEFEAPEGSDDEQPGESSDGSDAQFGEHTHSYKWTVTADADCDSVGSRTGKCSICGSSKTEEIPALGHDWDESGEYVAPTCTNAGYSASAKCRRCKLTRNNEVIPALGHDFNGGALFVDTPATCYSAGRSHVYCVRNGCNVSESRTIPQSDHIYTSQTVIKKADCTHAGLIQMRCKFGCGNVLDPQEVPALGHDWCEDKIIKAPTCTQDGQGKHHCLVCKVDTEYTINKLGHVYGEFVIDTPATQSQEGSKSRHCVHKNCTEKIDVTKIDKITQTSENVTYELRIRRTNKFAYTGFDNLKFNIYKDAQLLKTIDVKSDTISESLPIGANKLKVEGLSEGFSTTQEEYTLNPGNPIVTITVKAAIRKNDEEKAPAKLMDDGDVMVDFVVRDINNMNDHSKDKKLSEVIKGKKLILFDFFWTGCTSCSGLMKIFNRFYENELQPYKDDILVIMLDSIDYTDMYGQFDEAKQANTDRRLQDFRHREGYSDDYIISKGFPLQWFQLEGHNVRLPGHVWMDGEGVLYKLKTIYNEEDFRNFIFGFLENYDVPDKIEQIPEDGAKIQNDNSAPADLNNLISMDKPYVYGRKFD